MLRRLPNLLLFLFLPQHNTINNNNRNGLDTTTAIIIGKPIDCADLFWTHTLTDAAATIHTRYSSWLLFTRLDGDRGHLLQNLEHDDGAASAKWKQQQQKHRRIILPDNNNNNKIEQIQQMFPIHLNADDNDMEVIPRRTLAVLGREWNGFKKNLMSAKIPLTMKVPNFFDEAYGAYYYDGDDLNDDDSSNKNNVVNVSDEYISHGAIHSSCLS